MIDVLGIDKSEQLLLEIVASSKEHKIITTNADEVISTKIIVNNKEDTNIKLDLDKGLFYGKQLSSEEKIYLTNNKYKVGSFIPIGKKGAVECWVKSNNVESLSHTFLVYNIKENLEKYGKVEIFVTQKPDLILTKKNGDQVIIEVETGLSFLKNKKALYNKYIKLKEEYGDKVIFVLTDAHYRKRYEALFNESDIIFSRQELDGLFESFRN